MTQSAAGRVMSPDSLSRIERAVPPISNGKSTRSSRVPAIVCLLVWGLFGSSSLPAVDFGDDVPKTSYPAIGQVQIAKAITEKGPEWASFGTGTLIAPDLVLTAAHVVANAPTPRHVFVKFESQDKAIGCIAYRSNPGYLSSLSAGLSDEERNWLKSTNNWENAAADIALLKLERPIPRIETYPLAAEYPAPQAPLTVVGYGLTADKAFDFKRRSGELKSLRIHNNMVLVVSGNSKNQKTDHGDSGGPLLIRRGDKLEIVATVQGMPDLSNRLSGLTSDEWTAMTAVPYIKPWADAMIADLAQVKLNAKQPVAFIRRQQTEDPQLAMTLRQFQALVKVNDQNVSKNFVRLFVRGLNEPVPLDVCQSLKKNLGLSDNAFYPPLPAPAK
ncbi:MAG: trypsin [Planctomycetaceae bacterium]|nr:trypsin [Planctomycetaceae bacterium]